MPTFLTACPRNCYSTCSMQVTVEEGRLVRIEPHPGNLATPEGVCLKGLSYIERQHSPDRLLHPMRRNTKGGFDKIGWDEALDEISDQLLRIKKIYGPQAVFYYAGSGSKGWLNRIGGRFWRLYGGYTGTYGDLCWPAGLEATRLTLGDNKHSVPWDLANSRLIVMWGKNPAETNIHQVRFIEQALAQGGILAVIDPRRTETASKASLHIQPRPGTDGALALGLANLLIKNGWIDQGFIEQNVLGFQSFAELAAEFPLEKTATICGIPAGQVVEMARLLGEVSPASIHAGFGMQRYTNGGQTIRSIIALCVLTGNIGKPGAGWNYANLQSFVFDPVRDPLDLYPPEEPDGVRRIAIAIARLGRDMLATNNPPLKAMWVERGNPVSQNPESHLTLMAMRRLDFRIVIDEFTTDTAREADIILPSKTFFEQTDLITAYWHSYLQLRQKVLDSPGEVRPETEIYWELGKRMGYSALSLEKAGIPRPGESEAMLKEALEQVNQQSGSGLSMIRLADSPQLAPGTQDIAFADMIFPTPSGKVELFSEEAARRWNVDPLPRWVPPVESALRKESPYPLQMLTPNTKNSIHSQFNNLAVIKQYDSGPALSMHPDDARERGISQGNKARVFNDRGELVLPVRFDLGIKPGCVSCPNGYWIQHGGGVNLLSEGRETDMGHGAAFHDNLVQVEAVKEKGENKSL